MKKKKKAEHEPFRPKETDEVSPEWYTSGCIILRGKAHLVTAHTSLLIMQTRLYAEVQASAHERDAKTATTASARLLMERIARDLRRWATGDPAFLESSASLWQCSVSLAVRAKLGFLSVTEENFDEYITKVMSHMIPARRSIPPTFLLLTGPSQPELFVTQDSAHLAQFAGDWVYSQVVSKADLQRRYNRVAEDYPERKSDRVPAQDKPVVKPKPVAKSAPVAKSQKHSALWDKLGLDEADREQFRSELLDFVFSGVPSKKFSHLPPRALKQRNPHDEKKQNAVPPSAQDRQPNRDSSDLSRRREALLVTARVAGIPLGFSDVFATDLIALEASLAENSVWRTDAIQDVLRAVKIASVALTDKPK